MAINIEKFKKILEEELVKTEQSLSKIAQRNPENPDDWEPIPVESNAMLSDESELADSFDNFENRAAMELQLEESFNDIKDALARIKNGTYGLCEKCGDKIPVERLEAYPTARNCIKHSRR